MLSTVLAVHPSDGWANDTGNPPTPLALAFAAAAAEKLEPSEYRYALDYESLAVKLDATIDPKAPLCEGLQPEPERLSGFQGI